eukprot:36267_1
MSTVCMFCKIVLLVLIRYMFITNATAPTFLADKLFSNISNKSSKKNVTAKNTTTLNFATYIITQNALTDAPERYSQFVTDALNWLNAQQFPAATFCPVKDCCSKYVVYLNEGTHHFSIAGLNDIKLKITANGFSVWTLYTISINAPVSVWLGLDAPPCWIQIHPCNQMASTITGTADTTTNVIINWNTTTRKATIIPQPPIITTTIQLQSSCQFIEFLDMFNAIKTIINQQVAKAVTNAIMSWAAKAEKVINLPNTFEAYPGVRITYYFTSLVFSANQWAVAAANGYLQAQNPTTGKWITYVDYDIAGANMQPSVIWPWENIINQQVDINGKIYNERLWLLNGLRVTSSLLTALMWAADTIGDLTPSQNFTVLDATLTFNLTWDKPLLGVPYDNILSVEMGYGVINGTCYDTAKGKPAHNETVIISFSFTHLVGNGTVSLDFKNSQVEIEIEVLTFNTSVLYPVLIKPKLPLPTSVVENLMRMLINDSIPMINSYLASNAVIVPSEYAQWVPNPNLTLIHQAGCCNGTHGYMQFYSLCSCDEHDPQWSACSNLPCGTPAQFQSTITKNQMTHQSDAIIQQNAHQNIDIKNQDTVPFQIWLNMYSGSTSYSCNFMNMGDEATITLLNNTNGQCKILSTLLPPNERYYLLDMPSKTDIRNIRLVCNAQCTACAWPPLHQKIKLKHCYDFTYSSTIMLFSASSAPCIGGQLSQSQIKNNPNTIIVTYNGSVACQSNVIQIKNLGNITNHCALSPNSPNYNILNPRIVNGTQTFNLGMNCSNTCAKCHKVYGSILYDTCFATIPSSMKFFFANDTTICTSNNSNSSGLSFVGQIMLPMSAFVLVICVIFGYKKKEFILLQYHKVKDNINCNRPHVDCSPLIACCSFIFITQTGNLKKWVIDGLDRPKNVYEDMTIKSKSHNLLLFIASLCIILQLIAWSCQSPWDVFDEESFEQIGVPSSALDITNLQTILDDWQQSAEIYFGFMALFIILCVMFRFCCIRKCCWFEWYSYRVLLLSIYITVVFMGIYLLCPTFYEFSKSIKLNPNNSNAFTGSTDIQNIVDNILGYSFVGVFLSYFSNILLFWMHSIPVGVYIATLFFIFYLFETGYNDRNVPQVNQQLNLQQPMEDDNKYAHDEDDVNDEYNCCCCFITIKCKDPVKVNSRELFRYNTSKELKATMIARLIVIVFLLQAMASCIESLPVVIMYQSFGSDVGWIIAWLLWWIIPVMLLMHLWWICNQYIKALRDEVPLNVKKCKKHIVYNGISELVLFVIVMIVSLISESNKTLVAIWFLVLTCFAALLISCILWVFVVHYMFKNIKNKNIPHDDAYDNKQYFQIEDNEEEKQPEPKKKIIKTLQYDHHKPAYCCVFGCWSLLEKTEIQEPRKYGERVKYRRLFLTLGVISYGYVSIKAFCDAIRLTVKQEVINFFNDIGANVSWPDDDSGGTLFNSTFSAYNTARLISCSFGLAALILFSTSLLCDWCIMNKRGLKLSKTFGWISMLALAASMFGPSLPNYLSSTPIHDICPYCAPQFTNAIYLLFGDIVGLFCSGLFTIQMLPILVGAVTPAVARSSYMVLHYHNDFKLDADERDTLRYIFICGSFLGPFVTFAPLLVYQQFMGDVVISVLLMIFWILPILIAMRIKTENATRIYVQYMVTYYMTLFAMFIYHWSRYGLPSWLVAMIKTPHWIIETSLEIIAEWCLTNVLLSDFLYTIIMGFRTKHLEDEEIIKRNAIVGK